MKELTELPGVARKTANIVLSNAFGIVEGIAVDTHVSRLARRLGLSKEKNRDKIETELMSLYRKEDWFELTNLFIAHGRDTCTARRPKCQQCNVQIHCPSAFKFNE
jgi:endonuclease-3